MVIKLKQVTNGKEQQKGIAEEEPTRLENDITIWQNYTKTEPNNSQKF